MEEIGSLMVWFCATRLQAFTTITWETSAATNDGRYAVQERSVNVFPFAERLEIEITFSSRLT
jgi:hypothetical protein